MTMYGILRHILIFMFVVLLSNTVSAQVDSNLSKDAFDKYREEMFNEFDSFRGCLNIVSMSRNIFKPNKVHD